jgi:hypothetical protein
MPITDLLATVGAPGSATSLAAPGKAVGATSINITSAINWPSVAGNIVFFAIRNVTTPTTANPSGIVAASYTEWKGTITGTVISNLQIQPGPNGDQIYTAGTNTQVFIPVTASRENALVTWGSTHADLQGNLLPSAVQTAIGTGGIAASNLAANAVTFPKLLSTIYSGQVQTYTNTGSAGGTFSYINLGGIKLFWGITNVQSISGTGPQQGSAVSIIFPPSFFTTIQSILSSIGSTPTGTSAIFATLQSQSGTTSISVVINQLIGSSGAASISCFVVGT